MRGSEFIFDSVNSLHYKLHKKKSKQRWKLLKTIKATINPKSNDDKYFQYA